MVSGSTNKVSESITIGINTLPYGEILNNTIVIGNRNFSENAAGPEAEILLYPHLGQVLYVADYEDENSATSHNTTAYYISNYKLNKTGSGIFYDELKTGSMSPIISIGQNLNRFVNDVGQNLNESSILNVGHNTKYFARPLNSPHQIEYTFEDGNFDQLSDGDIFYQAHRTIPIKIYWNSNNTSYTSNIKRQNSTDFPGGQFPSQTVSQSSYWINPVAQTAVKTGSNINTFLGNSILDLESKYNMTSVLLSSFIPNVYDSNTDEQVNWSYFGFQNNIIAGNNTFIGDFNNYSLGIYDWIVSGSRFKIFPSESNGTQNDWYTIDNYNYQYGIAYDNIVIGHETGKKLARSSNILLGNNNLNNTAILANVFTDNTASGKFVTKPDDSISRNVLSVAWNPGNLLAYPSQHLSMDPYAGKDIFLFGFNQLNNVTASNIIMFGHNLPSASVVTNIINAGYNNFNQTLYSRNDTVFGNYNLSGSVNAVTKSDSFENILLGNYNLNLASSNTITSSYATNNIIVGQNSAHITGFVDASDYRVRVKDNVIIGNDAGQQLGAYSYDNIIMGSGVLSEVSGNIGQTIKSFIIGNLTANAIKYKPDPLYKNTTYTQLGLLQIQQYGFSYPAMYSQYIGHGISYSGSLDINTIVVGNKAFVSQSEDDTNNIIIGYKAGRNRPPQTATLDYDPVLTYEQHNWFVTRSTGTVILRAMPGQGADSSEPSGFFQSDTLRNSIVLGNLSLYNTEFYQYPVKNSVWVAEQEEAAVQNIKPNASLITIGERVLSNTRYEYDSQIHTIAIGTGIAHNDGIAAVEQKLYNSIILGSKSGIANNISHSIIIGANTVATSQSISEYIDTLRLVPEERLVKLPIIEDCIIIGTQNINLSGSVTPADNSSYWIENEFYPSAGVPFIGGIGDNPTGTAVAIESSYTASKYTNNIVIGNNTLLSHRHYTQYELTIAPFSSTATYISNSIVQNNVLIGNNVATKLYLGQHNTIVGNEAGLRLQGAYNLSLIGFGAGTKARNIQRQTSVDSEYGGWYGAPVDSGSLGTDIFGFGYRRSGNYIYNPHFDATIFGYDVIKRSSTLWRETAIGARAQENKSSYWYSVFDRSTVINTYSPILDENGNRVISVSASGEYGNNIESDVAIGYKAGADNKVGEMNVFAGAETDNFQDDPNYPPQESAAINSIVIGHNANRSNIDVVNEITIGNPDHAAARLMGANGWWYVQSDIRDKKYTSSFDGGLEFINKLNPKTYKWDSRYYYASGSGSDGSYTSSNYSVGFIAQDISQSVSEFTGTFNPGWYYNNATSVNLDKTTTFEKIEILTDNLIYPLVNSIKTISNKVSGNENVTLSGTFQGFVDSSEITVNDITLNKLAAPADSTESILIENSNKKSLMTYLSNNQMSATMSMILVNLSSSPTSSQFANVVNSNIILTGLNTDGTTVKTSNITTEIVYSAVGSTPTLLTSSINILNNQLSASIQLQVLGNSIIARVYPQGNDWTYLSYPSTYSVGASLTLIRPNFNASSKIYKPD